LELVAQIKKKSNILCSHSYKVKPKGILRGITLYLLVAVDGNSEFACLGSEVAERFQGSV